MDSRYIEDYPLAPIRPIPPYPLLSIEYPGYITSQASASRAISTLGGPSQIDRLRSIGQGNKELKDKDAFRPELNFGRTTEEKHTESRWKRPINGAFIQGDKLVLVVRKRRKVRVWTDAEGVERRERLEEGEFTVDVLGPVAKTVKFRGRFDGRHSDDEPYG